LKPYYLSTCNVQAATHVSSVIMSELDELRARLETAVAAVQAMVQNDSDPNFNRAALDSLFQVATEQSTVLEQLRQEHSNYVTQAQQHQTTLQQAQEAIDQANERAANAERARIEAATVAPVINAALLRDFKPAPFDAVGSGEELDTWIFHWDSYFTLSATNMSEMERVYLTGMNLKGSPALWFRDICHQGQIPQTWEHMKTLLRTTFMPLGRAQLARDKLSRYRMHDNDTLVNYTSNMRRLFLAIPGISEDEKLDRYVRGLIPSLRKDVYLRQPQSFEEAVSIAALHDVLRTGTKRMGENHTNAHRNDDMELDAMHFRKNNRHFNKQGRFNNGYNKGNNNHPRQGAPKTHFNKDDKDRCWICNEKGHFRDQCPRRQQQYQRPNQNNGQHQYQNKGKGDWRR
jgi:Ty3 transposon capsid-like protein